MHTSQCNRIVLAVHIGRVSLIGWHAPGPKDLAHGSPDIIPFRSLTAFLVPGGLKTLTQPHEQKSRSPQNAPCGYKTPHSPWHSRLDTTRGFLSGHIIPSPNGLLNPRQPEIGRASDHRNHPELFANSTTIGTTSDAQMRSYPHANAVRVCMHGWWAWARRKNSHGQIRQCLAPFR